MDKIHFEKLTPQKDADLNVYDEAIDFVFKNRDITNVAISGSYGAGKSSIIESYEETNKDKKFLHISLAKFQNEMNDEGDNKNRNDNSVLEWKIINQLLHQIDTEKIPQINFRIKKNISNKRIAKSTLRIVILILCLFYIKFYLEWSKLVQSLIQLNIKIKNINILGFLSFTTKSVSLLIAGIIAVAIIFYYLFNVMKIQYSKGLLKKFKFQDNEIEFLELENESYFDKYLNEVLYIFEYSDVDVIVFEDIDRYNTNIIFQRLREINKLVNLKLEKEGKKQLIFFYLLRDDIFLSKDRTKFFDFIMPIVPVMDTSNSCDRFKEILKEGGISDKFKESFLQGISLYIDDMRLLKNIYNEFIIYCNKIRSTEQDYNKLMAMIIYKNIFPKDFSDTQINIGFIYTLFNNKEEFIINRIDDVNKKIEKNSQILNNIKNEYLKNEKELEFIYSEMDPYNYDSYAKNKEDYKSRKEALEIIKNEKNNEIEQQIKKLNQEKIDLKNEKLSNIITRENIDQIFNCRYRNFLNETNNFEEIKSSQYFDLLKYLVREGYIDETYEDYMTYFVENSITKNDKMFLRSITDKKAKEWSYKLNNVKLVFSKLSILYFDEIETLNFDLFDYILNIDNTSYLIRFIEQLKQKKQFEFIENYISMTKNLDIFILKINSYWKTFLKEIINLDVFSYEQKKNLMLLTLYNCENENIDEINQEGFLTDCISQDINFLDIENPNIDKLIAQFLRLNIKFKELNFEKSNFELYEKVYENNLYEFKFINIYSILKNIYNIQDENKIRQMGYSIIRENEDSKLYEYIEENIQVYIQILIDNSNGVIKDDIETVLSVINSERIELIMKKDYIKVLHTEIKSLNDVKQKELWDDLIDNQVLKCDENNILEYYLGKQELSDKLIEFMNNNDIIFKFNSEKVKESFEAEDLERFFKVVSKCSKLSDDKYENIVKTLEYKYEIFDILDLQDEKIKILVSLKLIEMNNSNLNFIRENYKFITTYFIICNIEDYLNSIVEIIKPTQEELVEILSSEIEDKFKMKLLGYIGEPISVISTNYSDSVKDYIMRNNFNDSDLINLVDDYDDFSEKFKENVISLCKKYIAQILEYNKEISIELLEYLLSSNDIEEDKRLQLFTNQIKYINQYSECQKLIELIGSREHNKLLEDTRYPKLEINEINRSLLIELKKKHWIRDFSEKEGTFRVSRKSTRRK